MINRPSFTVLKWTLLAGMTLVACAAQAAAKSPKDFSRCRQDGPDVEAIRAATDRFVKAIDREDVDTLISTYAPDIEFLIEGGPTHSGVEHARENFKAQFAAVKMHYVVQLTEVTVCGPIAYDVGSVVFEVTPKSGRPAKSVKARFMEIWRHGDDGWKILREMNNRASRDQ